MTTTPISTPTTPSISNPAAWHRALCWIADSRIALCGDLPSRRADAKRQLREWTDAGVTHIVDVREEWSDETLVAEQAPGVTYFWLGTHDHGGAQEHGWFAAGADAVVRALADPGAKVVVHCHMGVNRGPSMGFAALLALGIDPAEALDAIRAARPIAAVLYAGDAIDWWSHRRGADELSARAARRTVRDWRTDNPVDVGWIVSRIRASESRSA